MQKDWLCLASLTFTRTLFIDKPHVMLMRFKNSGLSPFTTINICPIYKWSSYEVELSLYAYMCAFIIPIKIEEPYSWHLRVFSRHEFWSFFPFYFLFKIRNVICLSPILLFLFPIKPVCKQSYLIKLTLKDSVNGTQIIQSPY